MGKFINLVTLKFGRLTVIKRDISRKQPSGQVKTRWICVCDCGNVLSVDSYKLRSGHTKSCGCLRKEIIASLNFKDLTGKRFGRLVVIERTGNYTTPKNQSKVRWFCRCDCGGSTKVTATSLQRGTTKSCGCLLDESRKSYTDLTGKQFNRLTVLGLDTEESLKQNRHMWRCKCSCGNLTVVRSGHLCSGLIKSCGCLNKESLYKRIGENNPNWKGGTVSIIKRIRKMPEYTKWRTEVFLRDNRICRFSREKSSLIEAHHKIPLYQIIKEYNITTLQEARKCELLWDINNGITLLRKYHRNGNQYSPNSFHNVYGTENFTEQNFYDWMEINE